MSLSVLGINSAMFNVVASVDITCPSGEAAGGVMAVVMTCSPPTKKAVKTKLVKTRGRAACASYSNAALPKDQILPVETMVKEAPSQGRACSKVPAATELGSDRNAACEDVASNIRLRAQLKANSGGRTELVSEEGSLIQWRLSEPRGLCLLDSHEPHAPESANSGEATARGSRPEKACEQQPWVIVNKAVRRPRTNIK
ncbi:hypothetical protein NDU88_005990 [Pleurodeles waltl]|uniref:Uncharacterized protein n=1 Tax=Pleurodeles waltl TaxID=8319 RepID=A0AAV7QMC4_PLEWA|nr:hypothetical protein NDU88_005990 [Pleurodeles waltl]